MYYDRDKKIEEVLASIPAEQYVQGYKDAKGKEGFRNPVRPVVGEALTRLVEHLGFEHGVELGTALGRSGLHMALGGLKHLATVEFDREAAKIAKANFTRAGLSETDFVVHNMDSGEFTSQWRWPIDLLFIDHAKERYLEDLQTLEPYLDPRALVLLDNTFNRASECKDAVAYVADNYYSAIFTEPPTDGETTGLLVASKTARVFDGAMRVLIDVRGESFEIGN